MFLLVGHTKNACERILNSLKCSYRVRNVWTFDQLLTVLDESYKVTVKATNQTDFFNWSCHLDSFSSIQSQAASHVQHEGEDIKSFHTKKIIIVSINEATPPDALTTTHPIRKQMFDFMPNYCELPVA